MIVGRLISALALMFTTSVASVVLASPAPAEGDAASFDLDIAGTWTFLGRDTDAPTMLGFDLFKRDTLGTDIPPQLLFTQFGGL